MRGTGRVVSILLAVLSIAGIVGAVLFLRTETQSAQKRQSVVRSLSSKLEPINEERKDWQAQDKEWQDRIMEKKKGVSCVLLCFDDISAGLYKNVFNTIDDYGFKATFSLKNGVIPGIDESDMDEEEFQEILDFGWEYAYSFTREAGADGEEESADGAQEEQTEENTEEQEEIITGKNWLEQIDQFKERLTEYEMTVPEVLFCTKEQYDSVLEKDITSRGIQMVRVLDTEGFPYVSEAEKGLWRIDSGLYTQRSDLGNKVETAVQNGEDLVISINEVLRISRNAKDDLTSSKLNSLLGSLKSMEEQELVHIFTFSEYSEYKKKEAKEYKELLAQYAAFREEMNAAIASLDQRENELVEEAKKITEQE